VFASPYRAAKTARGWQRAVPENEIASMHAHTVPPSASICKRGAGHQLRAFNAAGWRVPEMGGFRSANLHYAWAKPGDHERQKTLEMRFGGSGET